MYVELIVGIEGAAHINRFFGRSENNAEAPTIGMKKKKKEEVRAPSKGEGEEALPLFHMLGGWCSTGVSYSAPPFLPIIIAMTTMTMITMTAMMI